MAQERSSFAVPGVRTTRRAALITEESRMHVALSEQIDLATPENCGSSRHDRFYA
jgi:hypothetical protein